MIGRIEGELVEKQPPHLLVDVQGVGYELEAPMSTFYRLPTVGQTVVLHTHFVVREDAQQLFAFFNRSERTLFRTLIKVNGVGPKLGLAILSGIETDDFVRCVNQNDIATLVRVPGVGKKTAERLIIEMKDKFKDWMPADQSFVLEGGQQTLSAAQPFDPRQEAESALVALGYKPAQATKSVSQAFKAGEDQCVEELIRAALKSMI